jgi:maltose/moltooligosaccharide transporter
MQGPLAERAAYNEALAEAVDTDNVPLDGADTGEDTKFERALATRYSVANLGASVVYGMFNTAMPLYLATYRIPEWLVGLLANERSFVGAFVQPVIGRISDRTRSPLGRRRPFFLVGVPLMAASIMLLSTYPDFWVMLLLMTIGSFFLAVAMDPYIALMSDLFPERHRGRVGGLLGLTTALGIIIFAIMASFLWEDNPTLVFAITVGILVLTFAFTFFTVKEPPAPPRDETPKKRPQPMVYFRELLTHREASKYVGTLALYWLGAGGATPFVTLFGRNALGASDSEVFILPLAFVVTSAIFAVPAGILADRIGKKQVMTAGLLIYGLGAIVGSQSADLMQATIALAIIGIGNAGTSAPLNALLIDLIPRKRAAELVGMGSAVWSFAQPVGSVLAGLVVGLASNFVGESDKFRWSFIFAGVMIVLAAIVLQTVKPERRTTTT